MTVEAFNRDISIQFGLAHDCMRACIFADHIARTKPKKDAWPSLMDICYTDAVLTWTQLFGNNSEQSHWKHFVGKISKLPSGLRPFSAEIVVQYLLTTESDWRRFHKSMIHARNVRLAHLNAGIELKALPNISWAMQSCYIYREWLLQLLLATYSPAAEPALEPQTGPQLLNLFRNQIAEVCADS